VGNREECAKSGQEVGRSGFGHSERTAKPENEAMYREGSMERQEHYHGPKAWESSVRIPPPPDECVVFTRKTPAKEREQSVVSERENLTDR